MNKTQPQGPDNGSLRVFAVGGALVTALVLAGFWQLGQPGTRAVEERANENTRESRSRQPRISSLSRQAAAPSDPATSRSARTNSSRTKRNSAPATGPTLERGPSGMTRTYRHDFRGSNAPLQYFAKLEGIEATPEGLKLKKSPTGRYEPVGVVESQPIPTEIPINSVGVHWAQELPESTKVQVETSTSSDGVNWTAWEQVMPDDDSQVEPFFPDGRANPSYGDTIGALQFRSDNRGTFVRYRMTMTTHNPEATPVLGRVALTYMDSSDPGTNHQPQQEPVKEQ